ncbi:hypothetical protein B0H17DRAFT_1083957 [Mycena rosella]|uniref:AN1-type domain-containing protein n=1 Tax=Mycena rosella TaxID=1033263 RepID=A0AAD7D0D7_MYCRO|nr:hypothetical protein B0H17DRAFT_1083957 [Mycena rosella]
MASEAQLLSVGAQCSHQSCLLVDFLPFKCQHCAASFCQEHFMVSAHKCPKYDETKYNRVAPNCPLCNVPVSVRPGQDANVAMEAHFIKDCAVMTGRAKAKTSPVCAKARCGKTLFAPIRCTKCNEQFCPSHRFPADHSCASIGTSAPARPAGPTASSRLLDLNAKASAAGVATMGALKSMTAAAQAGASSSSRPASAPTSRPAAAAPKAAAQTPSMPNLFSKTDRRAKAERESRRRAMQERAKKGLLSEEEKLALAAEEAGGGPDEKKECVVM